MSTAPFKPITREEAAEILSGNCSPGFGVELTG